MLAYTYIEHGKFELIEKPKPGLKRPPRRHCPRDARQHLHQRFAHQAR